MLQTCFWQCRGIGIISTEVFSKSSCFNLGCVYIKLFGLNRAFSWHCIDIALMKIARIPITYSVYIFFHSHRMHQTCSGNKPDSTQVCESTCLKFIFSLVSISLATMNQADLRSFLEEMFLKHIFKHPHFDKN